jgi:hypothetical protein
MSSSPGSSAPVVVVLTPLQKAAALLTAFKPVYWQVCVYMGSMCLGL